MKAIVQAASLSEQERLALSALCDGPISAEGIAATLGLRHFIRANNLIGRSGRKVFQAAPRSLIVQAWRKEGRLDRWYHVVAPGQYSTVDGKFYFEVRPEIREALIALEWYVPLLHSVSRKSVVCAHLEGAEVLRLVSARERDPRLREQCIAIHGSICVVCEVDLARVYGEYGRGLIHVHHLKPLASSNGSRETDPQRDLVPVCPNCHAVIHRGGRLLPVELLRKAMKATQTLQTSPVVRSDT